MFYRIQQATSPVERILDPKFHFSISYCDDTARHGVSACESLEDLAEYFAQTGVPVDAECLLVTFDGDYSDEDDEDAHLGAVLTIPETIIATELADVRFLDMVSDAYDRLAA